MKGIFEDLTGRQFGHLTVMGIGEPYKNQKGKERLRWHCKCDCGKELDVFTYMLNSGKTTSCGCYTIRSNEIDLTGQKFGKLTVLSHVNQKRKWKCQCDCGNICIVNGDNLRNGTTKSCGCLHTTHHKSGTRLYQVWSSMKRRCDLPTVKAYKDYGGRGISVCDEWMDFQNFYDWAIANGYDETAPRGQCTIDRINIDGNYEPSNCRIITQTEQCLNTRRNRILTVDGKSQTVKEWCEELDVDRSLISNRINQYGWDEEKAIREPKCDKYAEKIITINGVAHNIKEWGEINNISPDTISCRINQYGWDEVRAVTEPTHVECRKHKKSNQ